MNLPKDRAYFTTTTTTWYNHSKNYPQNYYIGLKPARGYCETGQYAAC